MNWPMTGYGPKRRCRNVRYHAAFGVKAEVTWTAKLRLMTKATWVVAREWYGSIHPAFATDLHASGTIMSLACRSTLVGS